MTFTRLFVFPSFGTSRWKLIHLIQSVRIVETFDTPTSTSLTQLNVSTITTKKLPSSICRSDLEQLDQQTSKMLSRIASQAKNLRPTSGAKVRHLIASRPMERLELLLMSN